MLKQLITKLLRKVADDIESNNTNLSDSEMESIYDKLKDVVDANTHMSKYQACQYLNISRATFDRLVADGYLPRGEKRAGFKELSWRKSDLHIR